MLSSYSPGRRSRLEAQTKQVHDATGKSLNEIRTDLEFTGNAQKTIDRIGNGEVYHFLIIFIFLGYS